MAGPGHQYIVPGALPPNFYGVHQPVIYSQEDLQLLQQRLPAMQAGQIPLPVTRDGLVPQTALYSVPVSDAAKYRSDSYPPVSSAITVSQQQQIPGAISANPYMTTAGTSVFPYYMSPPSMPGTVPAIYPAQYAPTFVQVPMLPASSQYPCQSKLVYGTGSTYYDNLPQEYKAAYTPSQLAQSKIVGAPVGTASSGTDLPGYKGHLGKVSRQTQGAVHTGTPPPFNSTSPATAGAYPPVLIPTLPAAQHHTTHLHHQINQDGDMSGGQHAKWKLSYGGGPKGDMSWSYWGAK